MSSLQNFYIGAECRKIILCISSYLPLNGKQSIHGGKKQQKLCQNFSVEEAVTVSVCVRCDLWIKPHMFLDVIEKFKKKNPRKTLCKHENIVLY